MTYMYIVIYFKQKENSLEVRVMGRFLCLLVSVSFTCTELPSTDAIIVDGETFGTGV